MIKIYVEPSGLRSPKTTNELADWLKGIADQIGKIPNAPLVITEDVDEVSFYYDQNLKLEGLNFIADFSTSVVQSTEKKFKLVPLDKE